jgi:hypothetical protein
MPDSQTTEASATGSLPAGLEERTVPPPDAKEPLNLAISAGTSQPGTVTARKAGGLRDLGLEVNPRKIGLAGALQHLAKSVNIAFQADFGENSLESVYQAAIVQRGAVRIVHREYFGFGDSWFGQFGRLIRSLELTLEGPDPASPEGQKAIAEKGPRSIRGLLNLIGRKLDLVAEYEDRVPAYVEQMFDRLEASGIILGWNRDDWDITTTAIGLDVRITPRTEPAEPEKTVPVEPEQAWVNYPPAP